MKTIDSGGSHHGPRILAFLCSVALLLTACSLAAPDAQSPGATPEPAPSPQAGGHPPVILRVAESEQEVNGSLRFYRDIYFSDPEGDAGAATYAVTSSSLSYALNLPDVPIDVPAAEQRGEALFTEIAGCWQKMELAYEVRIRDQAGNLSEPVRIALSCATPPSVDTGRLLVSALGVLIPVGIALLLLFVFLFRNRPAQRLPALRSTVALILAIMTVQFMQGVLHEGGHSLFLVVKGVPVTLYVHTFFFSGFSRPLIPDPGIVYDVLGSAVSLLASLLITLPFWKRRSLAVLPFALLFPYSAMGDGFNVMGFMGDFHNVAQKTGLPAAPFLLLGALILCVGIIAFFSLLPLFGLDPRDKKALFALPAAMWSISVLSLAAAHLFVPGSPIDLEYFAGREILLSVNNFLFLYIGIVLAVLYVTLFRRLSPRLPGWLRTGTVALAWNDLRLPAIFWVVCVVIALMIVI